MKLVIADEVGTFAESKEQAKQLRNKRVLPAIRRGEDVLLDFAGVTLATQSFVHALVAEAIRVENPPGLDHLVFQNCAPAVKSIVEVVVSYAQDDWSDVVSDDERRAASLRK